MLATRKQRPSGEIDSSKVPAAHGAENGPRKPRLANVSVNPGVVDKAEVSVKQVENPGSAETVLSTNESKGLFDAYNPYPPLQSSYGVTPNPYYPSPQPYSTPYAQPYSPPYTPPAPYHEEKYVKPCEYKPTEYNDYDYEEEYYEDDDDEYCESDHYDDKKYGKKYDEKYDDKKYGKKYGKKYDEDCDHYSDEYCDEDCDKDCYDKYGEDCDDYSDKSCDEDVYDDDKGRGRRGGSRRNRNRRAPASRPVGSGRGRARNNGNILDLFGAGRGGGALCGDCEDL